MNKYWYNIYITNSHRAIDLMLIFTIKKHLKLKKDFNKTKILKIMKPDRRYEQKIYIF